MSNLPTTETLARNAILLDEYTRGGILVEVFEWKDKMYKVISHLEDARQTVEEMT